MKAIKSKLLIGTIIAAMVVPAGAASAQQRRDTRIEQRIDHRDTRQPQRMAMRDVRRDTRPAWQVQRDSNRQLYRAPQFRAPFHYQRFSVNSRIDQRMSASSYRLSDYSRYRLPRPDRYQTYVRHYNDLLLVNTRTGRVVRVYNNFYW